MAATTPTPGRVISVSSGKGGVGKTNISVNLAIALVKRGHRVCVFDADTSLANVNILLNIQPEFTLEQVLDGRKTIAEIVVTGPGDIAIVPAASGIAEFATLSVAQQKTLLAALSTLEQQYDYLIIDTAAGVSENVTTFLEAAEHCLLVVTPEPTSLTDAFALMKVLKRRNCESRIYVLTNMVDNYPGSVDIYKRLAAASRRYLQTDLNYLGYVPRDDYVRMSVQRQIPVTIGFPSSQASYRFQALAESIEGIYRSQPAARPFSQFWRRIMQGSLIKDPGTITVPVTVVPARKMRYPKTWIVRMQQNLVQLVRSRTLSPDSMKSLLASVIAQIDRYYPEIDMQDIQRQRAGKKEVENSDAD